MIKFLKLVKLVMFVFIFLATISFYACKNTPAKPVEKEITETEMPIFTQTHTPTHTETPTFTPYPTLTPVPTAPQTMSEKLGAPMFPHSAWKKIEETCFILNPKAGATTGSKTIYSLPGYDYDITLERVLEKGESGGFCCAGFISWMFYNILPNSGYTQYSEKFVQPEDVEVSYKHVKFYCEENLPALREISLEEARLGDLIIYGGQRTEFQHMGFYAGKDKNGNRLIWHSGNDGVGRMRVDRMRSNGVLNYVSHVYSYFEPPAELSITAINTVDEFIVTTLDISGPNGYKTTVTTDKNGEAKLTGLDLGRYFITNDDKLFVIADVTEAGCSITVVVY